MKHKRAFVIARHSERLNWTNDLEGDVFIYNSGALDNATLHYSESKPIVNTKNFITRAGATRCFSILPERIEQNFALVYNKNAKFAQIENISKESGKFIQYMLDYYPDYHDMNIFLQGYPFDHLNGKTIDNRLNSLTGDFGYVTPASSKFSPKDRLYEYHKVGRTLKEIYEEELQIKDDEILSPQILPWSPGGQFYITGDLLRRNLKEYYQKLKDIIYKYSDNMESPCVFERFWTTFLVNSPKKYRIK